MLQRTSEVRVRDSVASENIRVSRTTIAGRIDIERERTPIFKKCKWDFVHLCPSTRRTHQRVGELEASGALVRWVALVFDS